MFVTVRGRLALLFLGFLTLVVGSALATVVGLRAMSRDALVINLAGRQRMLLQAMTVHALALEQAPDVAVHRQALAQAAAAFDATLQALSEGGQAPYADGRFVSLPAARQPDALDKLHAVRQAWTPFHQAVQTILQSPNGQPPPQDSVAFLQRRSPALVAAMDEAVRAFEGAAAAKVRRLWLIQMTFLILAAALTGLGFLFTERTIVGPLRRLRGAAKAIGEGDLNTPVPVLGRCEVGELAGSLEIMRGRLAAMQEGLETQVRQRTQELDALYRVSQEVSSRLEIEHVLGTVVEKAQALLQAQTAVICLLDEKQCLLRPAAVSGPADAIVSDIEPADHAPAQEVLAGNRAVDCSVEGCNGACHILAASYRTEHLAAPLRVEDRVIGALCVGRSENGGFSPEEADILTRLGASAAVALENARLYEQAERVAALEERQRIAAEMHDGVAQTLSYLGVKLDQATMAMEEGAWQEALATLMRLRDAVDGAAADVRRVIAQMQAEPRPRQPLQAQLDQLAASLAADAAPAVTFVDDVDGPLWLSDDDARQALHVAREAALNASRHAQASRIVIRLSQEGEEAALLIEDDGRGFDPEALPDDGRAHFGLRIMQARAARLGGRLTVTSAPGAGARVLLRWPLARKAIAQARLAPSRSLTSIH